MPAHCIEHLGWQGIRLQHGALSLVIAPDIGGRIVSLSFNGQELMFTLPRLHGHTVDISSVADVRKTKREQGWLHYGGYKTWLAPQENWTDGLPFLDLDSGAYSADISSEGEMDTVRLTSPVCRETGAQFERSIWLDGNGRVRLEQTLINRGTEPMHWGLWDVTQVCGPGRVLLPVGFTSQFSEGIKAYPNEGRSPEVMERYIQRGTGWAIVNCSQQEPFKYGSDSREGWILGLLEGKESELLAYLKLFEVDENEVYAHQADAEVYDSGELPYFEMEVHSPLRELAPAERMTMSETWVLGSLPRSVSPSDWMDWVHAQQNAT